MSNVGENLCKQLNAEGFRVTDGRLVWVIPEVRRGPRAVYARIQQLLTEQADFRLSDVYVVESQAAMMDLFRVEE